MLTASAIVGLLTLVFGAVWYVVKRKLDHVETPAEKAASLHEEVSKEIVRNDADAANRRIDDWLRALQSNQRGQGNSAAQSGPGVQPKK